MIASKADDHGTWITAISDDHLPIFYATTNLWEFLGQGLPDKRWISIGVCQTADTEDNLRLGRALGDAIAESDRKVVLLASGALSHTFWPLRELRKHEAAGIEHIFTPEAAAADAERMQWFEAGDHARVLDTMPEFYRFRPEARFGHYLMMIGAIGEGDCTATGRRYGNTRTRLAPARFTTGSTGLRAASPGRAVRPKIPRSGNRRPVPICQPLAEPAQLPKEYPCLSAKPAGSCWTATSSMSYAMATSWSPAMAERSASPRPSIWRRWCRPRSSVCI